ncbi:MAG: hypothetical protein ABEL76_10305 [Bradymonadaceae bacterium]
MSCPLHERRRSTVVALSATAVYLLVAVAPSVVSAAGERSRSAGRLEHPVTDRESTNQEGAATIKSSSNDEDSQTESPKQNSSTGSTGASKGSAAAEILGAIAGYIGGGGVAGAIAAPFVARSPTPRALSTIVVSATIGGSVGAPLAAAALGYATGGTGKTSAALLGGGLGLAGTAVPVVATAVVADSLWSTDAPGIGAWIVVSGLAMLTPPVVVAGSTAGYRLSATSKPKDQFSATLRPLVVPPNRKTRAAAGLAISVSHF